MARIIDKIKDAESTSSPSNPFSVLDKREPPVFQQSLRLLAANSNLAPVYCPPHISVAWAIEGAGEGSITELRHEKGYEMATLDMVTDDPALAREKGLICLRYYSPDTTNRYVKFRELYLMVTKREWYENRQKEALRRAISELENVSTTMPDVTINRESVVGSFEDVQRMLQEEQL